MKIAPRHSILAVLTAVALIVPGAPAAADTDTTTVEDVAAAALEAAPDDMEAADFVEVPSGVAAQLDGGGEAVLASDPADGIEVSSADGTETLAIPLPGAARLDDGIVAQDGSVTYLGDESTPSINVVAAEDAIRVSSIIDNAGQTEQFAYDFGVGATVEIQEDGGAVVYVVEPVTDPQTGDTFDAEKIIADIAAPWAKDAHGKDVPTRYEASGSVLTQVVVHHGAEYAYPIVADPTYDRPNVFQFRVRFNRKETSIIYENGFAALGGFACAGMAAVCVLAAGSLVWNAGIAEKSRPKRCVQVTATQPMIVPGLLWWVDTYRGGPCR